MVSSRAIALFILVSLSACGKSDHQQALRAMEEQRKFDEKTKAIVEANQKALALKAEREAENLRDECLSAKKDRENSYQRLMRDKNYFEAAAIIRACALALSDEQLRAMLAKAETQNYIALVTDKKTNAQVRISILDKFVEEYPQEAAGYQRMRPELVEKVIAEKRSEELLAEKLKASLRKKEGVIIGMTQSDVIASSWGQPRSINRTTTAIGTSEQWVYGGGNYLYFQNGRLTSIQN